MKRWIHNIKFTHKLLVIVVAALVPIALLTFMVLRSEQSRIATSRLEIAGLQAFDPVENMLEPLADMQLWALAQVAGDPLAKEKLQTVRTQVEQMMAKHATEVVDYGAPPGEDARRWADIQKLWTALTSVQFANTAEVNAKFSAFREEVLSHGDYIAATSGLVLDPDAESYFIITGITDSVPDFESAIADMRANAAAIGASASATKAQLAELVRARTLTMDAAERIVKAVDASAAGGERGQELKVKLGPELGALDKTFGEFNRFVDAQIINSTISAPRDDVIAKSAGIMSAVVQLHGAMVEATEAELGNTVAMATRERNEMLLMVLAALAVSAAVTYVVATTTVGGLNGAVAAVQRLSEGDYTSHIESQGRDELARMMQALKQMQDKISGVLGSVMESAATVATAARQIDAGTADLSQRTEQQAANLEETASSMEEMTATVKQNADNARLANQLAQAARDQAEHGGSVVEQAVAAMSAIDGSSKKIADIISVIDEIAFQTNLLALNAAVEAARAGDQGRGFAVVASEVRSLAQRSASAAKEIKDLISDSVGKVEEGGRLVSESGRHLSEIVASVKKVSDVVGEITNASQEQAVSAEEISRAVMQMDEGTQQNAAMVEQASAAAASMNEQAGKLTELTGFFRLNATASAHSAPPAAMRTPKSVATGARSATAKEPPGGRERRAAGRPWSKSSAAASTKTTAASATGAPTRATTPVRPAAEAAGSGDWSEF